MELKQELQDALSGYKYVIVLSDPKFDKPTVTGTDDKEQARNQASEHMIDHCIHPKRDRVYFPIGSRYEKNNVVLTLNFEL